MVADMYDALGQTGKVGALVTSEASMLAKEIDTFVLG